jgi:hypothetical protein
VKIARFLELEGVLLFEGGREDLRDICVLSFEVSKYENSLFKIVFIFSFKGQRNHHILR